MEKKLGFLVGKIFIATLALSLSLQSFGMLKVCKKSSDIMKKNKIALVIGGTAVVGTALFAKYYFCCKDKKKDSLKGKEENGKEENGKEE